MYISEEEHSRERENNKFPESGDTWNTQGATKCPLWLKRLGGLVG